MDGNIWHYLIYDELRCAPEEYHRFAQERMTRIMFETVNVPVGAVVRLRRHRRQHGWTCPQLPSTSYCQPCDAMFNQDLARKRCCRTCSRTTSGSRRGNTWRSRVCIGRRADVGSPVPGSVIRMERGRWQGEPGLYIGGVQTESRRLRSARTGSSCLSSLRAWPRRSWFSGRRSRQSHGWPLLLCSLVVS